MVGGTGNDTIELLTREIARGSALQLMIILLTEEHRTGRLDVELPVDRVLSMREMRSTSYARKQIREDLAYLDRMEFTCYLKRKGLVQARIGTGGSCINKGMIYFSFDDSMTLLIPKNQFMALPDSVLATQRNENISARFLLTWRICQHKRMNLDRPNADLVPVKSLLECCPAIPAYRDLKYRQMEQKIVEPFETALEKCAFHFSWDYEDREKYPDGRPKGYGEFRDARVRIIWRADPYQGYEGFIRRKAKRRSRKSK